jgi:hypothetical protein
MIDGPVGNADTRLSNEKEKKEQLLELVALKEDLHANVLNQPNSI